MENIGINSISISISDLSLHQMFTSILRRLLMSRRCSHGNRKSMGYGRKWRRESPTIKCNIFLMGPFSIVRWKIWDINSISISISISDLSLHQFFRLIFRRTNLDIASMQ
ncbi:hypothetical protein NC651_040152 [Populus alba x Populus x berolinensis]|nr:hypothetical protein NC651_040152 [Populus alba x Populus x berolinensis]